MDYINFQIECAESRIENVKKMIIISKNVIFPVSACALIDLFLLYKEPNIISGICLGIIIGILWWCLINILSMKSYLKNEKKYLIHLKELESSLQKHTQIFNSEYHENNKQESLLQEVEK